MFLSYNFFPADYSVNFYLCDDCNLSLCSQFYPSCSVYFMNLCQPAYNTPDGCPKEAAVCRQRHDSKKTVDVLGMVYTQQLRAYGKEICHLVLYYWAV